ncbi:MULTISPECIES: Ig-like domain-containing protein [Hydrocarboniphaga]|uniref:Ig-like domain-containing protein n=1 Tax=Hydrocarboniphaga TaxID=243627 RepID=UPI002AB8AAB9|nr:cadherin-like domain-containing protein [Hydrocarboniphaga sp.]MDZ4077083.1 Ig-like domain-containing protein [Hydrocarboniphaga sp.]
MSFIRTMRARIGVALAAIAVAACGGGGGGGSDAPDTAAPRVTLTATPQTVEGGAFVALAASAVDAAGAALTPSLSCDRGTLQGSMLLTPTVTENGNVVCTATATDAGGRSGTARVTIAVTATAASLSLGEGQQRLVPGQVAVLFADALPLESESYEATLGSRAVTLHNAGTGLLWFEVPADAAAGNTTLQATLNGRPWQFDVELGGSANVANPRAIVRAALESTAADLAQLEADDGAGMSAAELEALRARRADVADSLSLLETTDDSVLGAVAQRLIANGYAQGDTATATAGLSAAKAFSASACASAIAGASGGLARLAAVVVLAGVGLEAVVVGPDPASRIIGAVLAGGGFVYIWKQADQGSALQNGLSAIRGNCRVEFSFTLFPASAPDNDDDARAANLMRVKALTAKATQKLAFENGEPLYFRPQSLLRIHESQLATVRSLFNRISSTIAKLPLVPAPLSAVLEGLLTEETQDVPAGSIGIGSISSGDVAVGGEASAAGELLRLEFSAANAPREEVDFSFTLTRPDAEPKPFEATLSIDLPEAEDAAIEVIQGVAAGSTLTTVGADTLEVVNAPAHGSVRIENDGDFVFTPVGQYFGPDQFKYRARNENGYSRVATVAVNIKRKFDGAWSLQIDRSLTSSNPRGLCSEEADTTETVGVSKITDTHYQASYAGQTINLNMGSVDDAGGLSGSLSVTYPDGPEDKGSTTESLSVRIPDSTHLSGTLTWNYSGPNGSCSGNSVITGTRLPGSF